jgi:hypothetical protein
MATESRARRPSKTPVSETEKKPATLRLATALLGLGLAGYFLSFEAPSAIHTALALRQAIWRKEDSLPCFIFRFVRAPHDPPFEEMLEAIEGGRRGRIRQGRENNVLHDREIFTRRGMRTNETYDAYRKVLSNFAHFSVFSHQMMMETSADWEKSWRAFLTPVLCVVS